MHRIDSPGATVDNKFTDGDPVAGVQSTIVDAAWLNDMQEEVMSVLAAAGIAPVKGTQDQLLKAIRAASNGVAGQSANVKSSVSAVSNVATFTADALTLSNLAGSQSYRITGFNKTVNLALSGAGGMDVPSSPSNGYVAIYAIYNPATGASNIVAVNCTSALAPNVYAGANMPAGYTASALISVLATNASSQFKIFAQEGRRISISTTQVFTGAAGGVVTAPIPLAFAAPLNAVAVKGTLSTSSSAVSNIGLSVYSTASSLGLQNVSGTVSAGGGYNGNFDLVVSIDQTIYVSTSNTAGTPAYTVTISEYTI